SSHVHSSAHHVAWGTKRNSLRAFWNCSMVPLHSYHSSSRFHTANYTLPRARVCGFGKWPVLHIRSLRTNWCVFALECCKGLFIICNFCILLLPGEWNFDQYYVLDVGIYSALSSNNSSPTSSAESKTAS